MRIAERLLAVSGLLRFGWRRVRSDPELMLSVASDSREVCKDYAFY